MWVFLNLFLLCDLLEKQSKSSQPPRGISQQVTSQLPSTLTEHISRAHSAQLHSEACVPSNGPSALEDSEE